MAERGYLEGSEMAGTFNMLRANDLIWSFVVNNYLMGKDPFPFDLLYWNSDSTRMPAGVMHSFYLRNMYLKNLLRNRAASPSLGVPSTSPRSRRRAIHLHHRRPHRAVEEHLPGRHTGRPGALRPRRLGHIAGQGQAQGDRRRTGIVREIRVDKGLMTSPMPGEHRTRAVSRRAIEQEGPPPPGLPLAGRGACRPFGTEGPPLPASPRGEVIIVLVAQGSRGAPCSPGNIALQ